MGTPTKENELETNVDTLDDTETIRELKGRLDGILPAIGAIHDQDRKFMTYVTGIVSIGIIAVTAVAGIFSYISFSRVESAAERAELLVEQLTNQTRPAYVENINPLTSGDNGASIGIYTIEPISLLERDRFQLSVAFHFSGKTIGPSGRIIGYEQKVSGPFKDFLSLRPDGTESLATRQLMEKLNYNSDTSAGVLVAANGNFQFHVQYNREFEGCETINKKISDLIENNKGALGTLWVRPVFKSIDNVPKLAEVPIALERGRTPDCSFWENQNQVVEEAIVVPPSNSLELAE